MPEAGIALCKSSRDLKCKGCRTIAHAAGVDGHSIAALCRRVKAPRSRYAGSADESGRNILISQCLRPRGVDDIAPKWAAPATWRTSWAQCGAMRCTEVRIADWMGHWRSPKTNQAAILSFIGHRALVLKRNDLFRNCAPTGYESGWRGIRRAQCRSCQCRSVSVRPQQWWPFALLLRDFVPTAFFRITLGQCPPNALLNWIHARELDISLIWPG